MTPAITQMIQQIARVAIAQSAAMIVGANSRENAEPGDPKIGGHPAACSSAAHILAALHLVVRNPADTIASKPHAAPIDHIYQHHLGLFRDPQQPDEFLTSEESAQILGRLREFSTDGTPVLQSYHARSDADSESFLPSGSVGLPAVSAAYLALAYRMAKARGEDVPTDAHFWALIGDSESREGSLMECLPDAAERELGSVTWIIDYNRQSLDGPRMCNRDGLTGTDAERLARSAEANGWRVINLQHGSVRRALFAQEGGTSLRHALETGFTDYEFQSLLFDRDDDRTRGALIQKIKGDDAATQLIRGLSDSEVRTFFEDLGGHDPMLLIDALSRSKGHPNRPTLIIAHTIKGWGLPDRAAPGNHSSLPSQDEVQSLLTESGLSIAAPFAPLPAGSEEATFVATQGQRLRLGLNELRTAANDRRQRFAASIKSSGGLPQSFQIDALRNVPMASTQWMWGQIAGRLRRIADTNSDDLTAQEKGWKTLADCFATVSPDVGTSTNLNPVMNHGVYGPSCEEPSNHERADRGRPALYPVEDTSHRHVRMDIAEGAALSCVGAMGLMEQRVGVRFLPALAIYDFFIKRALDQLFYNLYSGSSFLVVGTPSGVTLSPEGAQHCWKSDFQFPGLITWEPAFAIEVDWILHDSMTRMVTGNDCGRNGVLLRLVTRGLRQKTMLERLRRQSAYKCSPNKLLLVSDETTLRGVPPLPDSTILASVRDDCLRGAYWLVNYRGYRGYEPGDNVVQMVVMGALVTEAVGASDALLSEGIFADILIVSSADELLGSRPASSQHEHLQRRLGINGLPTSDGSRIPVVGICDGEAGLLDNLGSIVGVVQLTLGTHRHSYSGRPADVYRHHGVDADSIRDACNRALEASAIRDHGGL